MGRRRNPPTATASGARPSRGLNYPGQIRIIGGQWRGRRLPVPISEGLRPTPDRVRETVFNWLAPVIEGARCLDLFAGTGALCLEALSRGAAAATMVEQSHAVVLHLRNLVTMLGADGEVIEANAIGYLSRFAGTTSTLPFDVVFVDPPFASDLIAPCCAKVEQHGVLRPGGHAYIEAPHTLQPLPIPANWELIRSKTAGAVGYHLVRRRVSL